MHRVHDLAPCENLLRVPDTRRIGHAAGGGGDVGRFRYEQGAGSGRALGIIFDGSRAWNVGVGRAVASQWGHHEAMTEVNIANGDGCEKGSHPRLRWSGLSVWRELIIGECKGGDCHCWDGKEGGVL